MGRVEKFREIRSTRKKYIISALIFITVLAVGLSAADYSINSLMGSAERLRLLGISSDEEKVVFYFMNRKIDVSTKYVKQDMERLRQFIEGLFNKDS